jgi:hypothetical protein
LNLSNPSVLSVVSVKKEQCPQRYQCQKRTVSSALSVSKKNSVLSVCQCQKRTVSSALSVSKKNSVLSVVSVKKEQCPQRCQCQKRTVSSALSVSKKNSVLSVVSVKKEQCPQRCQCQKKTMQYQKLTTGETTIEFHNNWLGEETVIVNGQIVSKKYSVWGTNHFFTVMEDGRQTRYILTTRVDANMQVVIDLSKNGQLIEEGVSVPFGSRPASPHLKLKKEGLDLLKVYDLDDALEKFHEALEIKPQDAEIYFHMACAYSVLEKPKEGFDAIKMAIEHSLQDQEEILNHDMLAFLRMHQAFESFLNSGFKEYDEKLLENPEN